MIRVPRSEEPPTFDAEVRQPGRRWLDRNSLVKATKGGPDYWRKCRPDLERAFEHRCGYAAMWISNGQTDHYISRKTCRARGTPELAYEWTNLRWILAELNSKKRDHEGLIDPFEVEDSWFELRLPSLTLHLTDKVPAEVRGRAEATMKVLELKRGRLLVKLREQEIALFENGTSIEHIERRSPLVGRALRRLMTGDPTQLSPREQLYRQYLSNRRSQDQR